jgi:hypothetical protein
MRGFDGEVELAEVRADGGAVLGIGVRESENKRRERVAGLFVVPKRARERGLGLCGELATATAMWRPQNLVGVAWRGEGRSSAWGGGSRSSWGRHVKRRRNWTWPGATQRGGRRCDVPAVRESREADRGRRKWMVLQFLKFQGPKCKTRITFKLKLKWKSAQHESCSTFQDLQL